VTSVLLRIGFATLIAACLACCTAESPPSPSASPIETPSPNEADAIRIRTEFGLRSDVAYIRQVAADPTASSVQFSVPMLPAEIAEINRRMLSVDAIRGLVVRYTEDHPEEFAGIYIDHDNGGALTTMWTGHLDQHAAAIRELVSGSKAVAFRSARHSYRDLYAIQERIAADWEWMRAFEIAPTGVGVDILKNVVEVDISSANENATTLILDHYQLGPEFLEVISDGTGAALLQWGTVRGRVVDILGQAPGERIAGELILQWTSDGPGDCGSGDIGFGLGPDGSFEVPCQAGGHTIMVQIGVPDVGWETIGSGHVVAAANAVVPLEIRLPGPWPEPMMP